jgi:hypothetical protein
MHRTHMHMHKALAPDHYPFLCHCHCHRNDQVNPLEELLARSTRCRLSGERLSPPCVADELGSLFNKEALVHALLNKTMPAALSHIASLKSVVNLKLEPAHRAGSSSNGQANGSSSSDAADFQCPVTGLDLNGRFPFVIHRPTGQVLSERALREAPAAVEELLGGKWSSDDLIPVNPQGEELEKRQQTVAAALAAERTRKRAKKAGKEKDKAAAAAVAGAAAVVVDADGAAAAVPGAAAVGSKRPPVAPPAGAVAAAAAGGAAAAKKLKLPAGATPEVYASIFSTGQPKVKETFCCRSASGRGLGM